MKRVLVLISLLVTCAATYAQQQAKSGSNSASPPNPTLSWKREGLPVPEVQEKVQHGGIWYPKVLPLRVLEPYIRAHLIKAPPPSCPGEVAPLKTTVKLAVKIGKEGNVDAIQVLSGPTPAAVAALNAVKDWKFSPYKVNDITAVVFTELTIPMDCRKPSVAPQQKTEVVPALKR